MELKKYADNFKASLCILGDKEGIVEPDCTVSELHQLSWLVLQVNTCNVPLTVDLANPFMPGDLPDKCHLDLYRRSWH